MPGRRARGLVVALLPVLQIAEGIVGQALLIAQGLAQIAHRLLTGAALALTALALRHLHVFHELTQFLHQLGGLGGAAFLHQLLQFVQHLLELILRHGHRILALLRFVQPLGGLILFGQLLHVVIQRIAQFLHQRVNLSRVRPVADGFIQPVLRPAQAFLGRGEVAFFDQKGDAPQFRRQQVARFHRHRRAIPVQRTDHLAQAQVAGIVAEQAHGLIGHRFEDLRGAGGVGAGPQQVAAHFDQAGGEGVEKAAAGQGDVQRFRDAGLASGIGDGKAHHHRQV